MKTVFRARYGLLRSGRSPQPDQTNRPETILSSRLDHAASGSGVHDISYRYLALILECQQRPCQAVQSTKDQKPNSQQHRTPKAKSTEPQKLNSQTIKSQKIENWEVLRPRAIQWRAFGFTVHVAPNPAEAVVAQRAVGVAASQSDPAVSRMVRAQSHLAAHRPPHPRKRQRAGGDAISETADRYHGREQRALAGVAGTERRCMTRKDPAVATPGLSWKQLDGNLVFLA